MVTIEADYYYLKPLLRSLLQKAVRRGFSEIAKKTAVVISRCGDGPWLDTRISIIVFEECWPLSAKLATCNNKMKVLDVAAYSKKNKNAAGLGSLAFAVESGDPTPLHLFPTDDALKIVAAGLRRPNDFFGWIEKLTTNKNQCDIIAAARNYIGRASWAWDKAFMIAASYLCIFDASEYAAGAPKEVDIDFPYWIAVDRHTPQGRNAMHKISREMHVDYTVLSWASFYFESARVNEICGSENTWFRRELDWRLYKNGVVEKEMHDIWLSCINLYKEIVLDDAIRLEKFIDNEYSQFSGIWSDG